MAFASYYYGWNNLTNTFTQASFSVHPVSYTYESSDTLISVGDDPDPNGRSRFDAYGNFANGNELISDQQFFILGQPIYEYFGVNTTISAITAAGSDYNATRVLLRGNDLIEGSNERDILIAGAGDDAIRGLDGNDTLYGQEGRDLILGDSGSDLLLGEAGDDRIEGGAGNDTLRGGLGRDDLIGGPGSDTFSYRRTKESPNGLGKDRIIDFQRRIDRIDLRQIDAIAGGRNNAFRFIGNRQFWAPGQVRYANGILSMNTDRDITPEMQILLSGRPAITSLDLLL